MQKMRHSSHSSVPIRFVQTPGDDQADEDWVVLVHGLFATSRSMRKLEVRLREIGYRVLNWSYPTFWRSTNHHVDRLVLALKQLQCNPDIRSINFVTHSMGGILVRCALHLVKLDKVKRVVMLAPPNRGSHLTRLSMGPLAWCVPAISDLSEAPDSLPNRIEAPTQVEFGVIAASRDVVVHVANTTLPNQKDHCTLKATHFMLPQHEAAVRNVTSFLATGSFYRAA